MANLNPTADGYLAIANEQTPASPPPDEPSTPVKVFKKIPKRIIQNAAGIAVFTCMRNGLWMTGSGGSGILIARKSDGTWSPPSGIMLHTPTLSFIIGVDVYDCVLVINSHEVLEVITQPRVTLGEDVDLTNGPLVPTDSPELEMDINLRELSTSVLTYMKARGQQQHVNMKGCILTERANENERFYESAVSQMDVLSGNVARHVEEIGPLTEVIKLAEGRSDFDAATISRVAAQPAPGDANIASPNSTPQSPRTAFGIPQVDDPDPFGVLALEMAGMEIREAGSRLRPASSQIDFHQRPMSGRLSKNYRQSGETFLTRSNRESCMSSRTVKSQMTDAHTQTDTGTGNTPETSPSPSYTEAAPGRTSFEPPTKFNQLEEAGEEEVDYTTVDLTPLKRLDHAKDREQVSVLDAATSTETPTDKPDATKLAPPGDDEDVDRRSKASSHYGDDHDGAMSTSGESSNEDADDEDDLSDEEEPVVYEVASVQQTSTKAVASRMIPAKGNVVNIPKRIPPPLPVRNPARSSMASRSDVSGGDAASLRSPLRQKFSGSDLNSEVGDAREDDKDKPSITKVEPEAVQVSHQEAKDGSALNDEHEPRDKSGGEPAENLKDEVQAHSHVPIVIEPKADLVDQQGEASSISEVSSAPEKAVPAEETKISQPETQASDTEAIETKHEQRVDVIKGLEPEVQSASTEESKLEVETAVVEPKKSLEDPVVVVTSPVSTKEVDEKSEADLKSRPSLDVDATEGRSSFEGSSYITPPTSEHNFPLDEDEDQDRTPKKAAGDARRPSITESKDETALKKDAVSNNTEIATA